MLQLFFFIEILMCVTSIENYLSQDDNLYPTTRPNIEVGSDPCRTGGILHFGRTTENRLLQEIANLEKKIDHMEETMRATTTTTTTPKPPPHVPGQYMGCYRDGFVTPAFENRTYLENNTIDGCNDICYSTGFKFSATEHGNKCFCSNNLPILTLTIHRKRPESYCDMSCPGNSNQICGGYLAMSIYETSTN